MSVASVTLCVMDAFTLLLYLGFLIVGLVTGWMMGVARTVARGSTERAELRERLAAAEAARNAVSAELVHQKDQYRELLAQSRSDAQTQHDRERREQSVLRALAPVAETLHSMKQKVSELERDRAAQFGSLSEQLRRAQQSDEALRETTQSLAGALRSTATRGVWGETQLRRIVEVAGLTRHVDFDTQSSVTSYAGAGRPDLVVRLPGNKSLAVDAKVPLDAFLEASALPPTTSVDNATRRQQLLARHTQAVRAHVDALSKKSYWSGLQSSPEFVICFLPNESLLATGLEEDPGLLDYAFSKGVALATPVNLWAVLKTVAYTWTQQDVSDQALRLFELGNQLYDRIGTLATHTDDLRRAIERTVDSYNRFAGSLETRMLVTARKFPGIDSARLEDVAAPEAIDSTPRRLSSPELLAGLDDRREGRGGDRHGRPPLDPIGSDATASAETTARAEVGPLRDRLKQARVGEGEER